MCVQDDWLPKAAAAITERMGRYAASEVKVRGVLTGWIPAQVLGALPNALTHALLSHRTLCRPSTNTPAVQPHGLHRGPAAEVSARDSAAAAPAGRRMGAGLMMGVQSGTCLAAWLPTRPRTKRLLSRSLTALPPPAPPLAGAHPRQARQQRAAGAPCSCGRRHGGGRGAAAG